MSYQICSKKGVKYVDTIQDLEKFLLSHPRIRYRVCYINMDAKLQLPLFED